MPQNDQAQLLALFYNFWVIFTVVIFPISEYFLQFYILSTDILLYKTKFWFYYTLLPIRPPSVQFSSVAPSCLTLCDPMNRSTPGLPVHHQLPEFSQTHAHRVGDAIQPSHPLLSPSPPTHNPSQHQGLFQRVNSLHEVAKVLEF